ncbi:Protein of unknown function [Pseudomonas cedrina]|uniref:DUF3375 domain-containing protein n=2 Tax=Pseudomonas cedrina TaxID=651740 RepID=A0A1V2KJJ1_PSECE|nr:DUF3375 domain-containing protein [Pseudomonas cedrina]ONH57565.1 hypothetical protein BLL36_02545 [Pseudomonas cedrina subsp. cedrina]SDT37732.1 Protein of unknown function [Pseudomonas cedrina]
MDYATLESLRTHHPAWRLLRSDHGPLVASFLHRVFVATNVRTVSAADLAESLEDELYVLRRQLDDDVFPKSALQYLNEWASPEKGWLRKFYRQDDDEPQFDLTPSTEKAIAWLATLAERGFVGTESRLLTLFELLKQMSEGSEADPAKRVAHLRKRRDELDAEIAQILRGDVPLLDDTALKDRFQQFTQLSRELLADFREVEHNFRLLDRRVRERIALWEGAKGALLEQIMGERDAISDSDQGRSFRAFWGFLMSSSRQEELTRMLDRVLALAPVMELKPDIRTRRVHYDWLEAGEHTQRMVAQLSQQLRRFLDDQVWLENRRIMDILHGVEAKALGLREQAPAGAFMDMADVAASIELPMERPLHTLSVKPDFAGMAVQVGDEHIDISALYNDQTVDLVRLAAHIHQALQVRSQITLHELTRLRPLQQGLAELVAYLHLGSETFTTVVDDTQDEPIEWVATARDGRSVQKQARLARIIFVRQG